jgi:hypothetical protein
MLHELASAPAVPENCKDLTWFNENYSSGRSEKQFIITDASSATKQGQDVATASVDMLIVILLYLRQLHCRK